MNAGADVVASGLATHLVPSARLVELQDRLAALGQDVASHSAIDRVIEPLQVSSCDRLTSGAF